MKIDLSYYVMATEYMDSKTEKVTAIDFEETEEQRIERKEPEGVADDNSMRILADFQRKQGEGIFSIKDKIHEESEELKKQDEPDVPYGYLAKDGIISYNGVTFVCDESSHSICLGDMSNPKNVLRIPLSGGGTLCVNKNNIGDLGKAISMFSAEDIGIILRAIEEYQKITSTKNEIEENENDTLEKIVDGKTEEEKEQKNEELSA